MNKCWDFTTYESHNGVVSVEDVIATPDKFTVVATYYYTFISHSHEMSHIAISVMGGGETAEAALEKAKEFATEAEARLFE